MRCIETDHAGLQRCLISPAHRPAHDGGSQETTEDRAHGRPGGSKVAGFTDVRSVARWSVCSISVFQGRTPVKQTGALLPAAVPFIAGRKLLESFLELPRAFFPAT